MREDRSIPDHVNDNVPVDEVDRYERFEAALTAIADMSAPHATLSTVQDARCMAGESSLTRMKRTAFINAAINNVPAVIEKMRPSYPGIQDLPALVKAVRLEVVIRRLG